jgi:hypothetical protein
MNYHRRFNFVTYKGNDWVAYILGKEKQHAPDCTVFTKVKDGKPVGECNCGLGKNLNEEER